MGESSLLDMPAKISNSTCIQVIAGLIQVDWDPYAEGNLLNLDVKGALKILRTLGEFGD